MSVSGAAGITAERNSLLAEVHMLNKRLQGDSRIKDDASKALCKEVRHRGAVLIHGLQVAIFIAYFLWEDYVWRSHCR